MRLKQILTLCLLLILLGHAAPVAALNFNAFWLHRVSGGEGRDTRSEWQQRYNLGVGPQFTFRPTPAITVTANVSYTQAQRRSSADDELQKTERVSASSRLSLINDIFTTSVAGSASQSRRDSEWGDVGRSWGATVASAWDIPFWPDVTFNYSEQHSDVDSARNLFTASDELQSNGSVGVDWDLALVRLNYRYSESTNENYITGNREDSDSHFIRAETDGRLFGDRLTYRLSQQYQQSRQDGENFGELRLRGIEFAKQMDGGINPDDPTDTGGADPTVLGVYVDPARALPQVVAAGNRLHVLFAENSGFAQQIDQVQLEFVELTAPLAPLSWEVYRRDSDLEIWQRDGQVTGEYDSTEDAIILPLDVRARQILLVSAPNSSGAALTLSSVRVYTLFDGGSESLSERESENISWLTNANLGLRLTRTLNASVSMTLEQREDESSSSQAQSEALRTAGESDRRSLSGRLSWSPRLWLSSSIGASETYETSATRNLTLDETSGDEERTNRTYSWSLLTRPLKTVNVTFGVTKSETEAISATETEAISATARRSGSGMQYSITTTARIYPDLNGALFLSHNVRDDESWSERDNRTTLTDNTSSNARIELDARLSRTLGADLNVNYSETQVDRVIEEEEAGEITTTRTASDTQSASSTLNLRYRPSSYLSMRGFYTTILLNSSQPDSMGASLTLALLRTSKARLTLNYSYRRAEESTHNLNMNGSWDITRKLALTSRASYSMAQTNFYAIETTLSLRL